MADIHDRGVPKAELINLTWPDIDFRSRSAKVRAASDKTHTTREIPLDDEAMAILAELKRSAAQRQPVNGLTDAQTARQHANFSRHHVFVTRANTPLRNNLLKRFYAVCRRAGIEGAHPRGECRSPLATGDIHDPEHRGGGGSTGRAEHPGAFDARDDHAGLCPGDRARQARGDCSLAVCGLAADRE